MATSSSSSFPAREPPEASGSGSARHVVTQPLAPLVPTRPSKKSNTKLSSNGHSSSASVKTCCAIDRWDEPCTEVVVGGHKGKVARWWCARHELEEQVVRDEFAMCALPDACGLRPDDPEITESKDLDELEDWESATRKEWDAADKALKCRTYHLEHFGAAGSDIQEGVEATVVRLEAALKRLEAVMESLNSRSHALILASEDALWLLPSSPDDEPSFPPCSSPTSPSLRPPCSPLLATEAEEPDPVAAVEKMKRAELLELLSLTGSHASFISDGRKSVERVRIVECLFRRLIGRDKLLLVRAYRGGHDHVLRFFEDPDCCTLPSLASLYLSLQSTSVNLIKEAITDAFRAIEWEESGAGDTEEGEEGMGLQLLGGWTYKVEQKGREMGWKEWGHLYDLCGCPGCALRCCATFTEWAKNRRLTVVSHETRPPPYLWWGDNKESDASKICRAIDVVRCSEERGGDSEIRRVGGGFVGLKGKGVFVERMERNWLFLKISLTHPKAASILSTLQSTFVLIARCPLNPTTVLPSVPLPPPAHLWFSRHRSAPSKAELRHQSWLTDPCAFGPNNLDPFSVFDSIDSPEKVQGMEPFMDVYELIVLDAFGREGEGTGMEPGRYMGRTWEQFEAVVGQVLLGAVGVRDIKGALEWGEAESKRRGDILFDFKGDLTKKKKGGGGGGGARGRKEKGVDGTKEMLESLRDDKLAFKLSRSLFR